MAMSVSERTKMELEHGKKWLEGLSKRFEPVVTAEGNGEPVVATFQVPASTPPEGTTTVMIAETGVFNVSEKAIKVGATTIEPATPPAPTKPEAAPKPTLSLPAKPKGK